MIYGIGAVAQPRIANKDEREHQGRDKRGSMPHLIRILLRVVIAREGERLGQQLFCECEGDLHER